MRILIVTGSSGGHIFPALSFLDTLKDRRKETEALLVLPRSSLKYNMTGRVYPRGYKINYISICPLRFSLSLKNIRAIFNFLKGSLQSLFIILRFRPDVVVGFGSLSSIPIIMFSWLFRIKTLTHEQNVLPGRANRLLAKFTDKMAVSFEETKAYLKIKPDKIVFTGNPLRPSLKEVDRNSAFSFFKFDAGKFTLLVMGGSHGSHRINTCFFEAISTAADKSRFQVIHITGPGDYDLLYNAYKDLNLGVRLFVFLEDMRYAYSISDLVICRGGATTIAELMYFAKPAVIVPYPFAYKHQLENARVLEKTGSAIVLKDDELNPGLLRQALDGLINNPDKIKLMRSRYSSFPKNNAGNLLVDAALN